MTPLEHYQAALKREGFCYDQAQEGAVKHTHALYEQLLKDNSESQSFWSRMLGSKPDAVRGLYFWGGVGRGKTFLIDALYECLPFPEKRRVHFHRFMQEVHNELKKLPKSPDPLVVIANALAEDIRLLCLDEFHVNDIADAMLLSGLLRVLFDNGVTLVTTSNLQPDELYKNGLQRERFLPAIALIKQCTEVIHLDDGIDYRLDLIEKRGAYHVIAQDYNQALMEKQFHELSPNTGESGGGISVNHHLIDTVALADGVVWFNFGAICETPRSSADYVEISRRFHTVLIDRIPAMDEGKDDGVKRFVDLVDALYDYNVKLIVTAETEPADLYSGRRLTFAFERTMSRLNEMRSHRYLAKAHKP